MKKFAVSLMAVFMLLVCLVAIEAPKAHAATEPVLYHCLCGNKHSTALTDGEITWKENTTACYKGCDGEILEWTAWSAASTKNAGNYYMISNHTSARAFTSAVDGTINVDMNGYNIQVTTAARAINAGTGNTINYCNTQTTGGLITAKGMTSTNPGTVIRVLDNTTLNLYGVDVAAYDGGNNNTNGGAVYINDTGSFTMQGGTLTGSAVSGNGGALYVNKNADIELRNVVVTGGSAVYGGNIYVADNHTGTMNLIDCEIYGGVATEHGGNLWLGTAGTTTSTDENGEQVTSSVLARLERTVIYNGSAKCGGGLLTKRRLNMVRSTVGYDSTGAQAPNTATDRGGSVFINNAELLVQINSKIGYGTATNDGGNVYVTGENGKLTVYDQSVIQWGTATRNGGNVYLNSGELYFGGTADATHDTGCQIVNGQASGNGGNIYVEAGVANAQGDALIAGGGSRNTTVDGGNIYIASTATFTLKGRSIVRAGTDLSGGQQAGNIYNAGRLEIQGSAKIYGGATRGQSGERNIYCTGGGTVAITDHINTNDEYVINDSVVRGGLMVNGGTLILEGSPWIKSNAVGGRSLYLFKDTVVNATGLTEGANVEIFDTAVSGEGRKIADVTAEQTWIKDDFRLSEDSTLAYVITREIDAEGNVSLWLRPAIAASVETETGIYDYQTTDDAIANCDAAQTIILDLKGLAMSLNIPGNLKLMDSANDDYSTQTGSFTGTVNGEVYNLVDANGKHYLVVENDGVYTAHRYDMALTHVSLDPANDALGYKALFNGDDVVRSHVTDFGFHLWVNDGSVKTYSMNSAFENDQVVSLRLKNILANNGGEMVINGNAFVTFDTADTVTSADYSTTMRKAVEAVATAVEDYSAQQIQAVQGLLSRFVDAVQGWNVDSILAWTDPEATV